jgi:hypothetical protein
MMAAVMSISDLRELAIGSLWLAAFSPENSRTSRWRKPDIGHKAL